MDARRIESIAKAVVAEYDREFNDGAIKTLERRIAKIDLDIQNAVNVLIDSGSRAMLAATEKCVEELSAQKADMEIDLSKLRVANGIRYTAEDVGEWLRQFCSGDLMDPEFRRRVIDVFINSVYLYDDKIVIFYNMRDSRQVSYIDVADALDGEAEGCYDEPPGGGGGVRISSPAAYQGQSLRQ
uniref:Uncharacterized protein n=1 Tax=uncultured bacterium contig00005 TaxID=1181497 RepID=A0A806JZF5_9BACT|nr:hypothetical protein [uncultured bacterium contig00005]